MLGGVACAAALTWCVPAGEFMRRDEPAVGRRVVIAGTYHVVESSPVGPFAAMVAVPRGFVEAADVITVVLFVGGAWAVVDKVGTLGRIVAALVASFRRRRFWAVTTITVFFAAMGALENMQEEIIPLVPVLLILGQRLGLDAITVVAASAGAAMVGSAFGPTNPFQAGIAMRLAELPAMADLLPRLAILTAAVGSWLAWTLRHASRVAAVATVTVERSAVRVGVRDTLIALFMLLPMAAYVYGALALGWGFNELSAGFLLGGIAAGIVGGLRMTGTAAAYLEGMRDLLSAAVLIGVARAISLVLADGRVIDTVLNVMSAPLLDVVPSVSAFLMVPFHAVIHVVVPSVSGHAVLTMPLLLPLSDVVGLSRQVTVLAYQTGAGLTELLTPTNGALMAILVTAGVPYQRWLRFAAVGAGLAALVGVAGMMLIQ